MSRPSILTPELFNDICDLIAEGKSLRSICLQDNMPHMSSVMRWLDKDDARELREQYTRAHRAAAELYAERTITESEAARGLDAPGVAAQRLIVDTLKWHASKLAPKKYGDKIAIGGADDLPPVQVTAIERLIVDHKNQK